MIGVDDQAPEDAELTAFLDGELPDSRRAAVQRRLESDDETRRRLAVLERGVGPLRAAFDLVLEEAPQARLSAMLARPPTRRRTVGVWRPMMATAAALVIFALGVVLGQFAHLPTRSGAPAAREAAESSSNWRQSVAEYFSLQTADTLAAVPDDASARARELVVAASRLGVPLSTERLTFAGLTLKRAEVFSYDGMPLTEVLYVDAQGGPLALCIIANGKPDASFQQEQRKGLNIVYWQSGERGFLVIGRSPPSQLLDQAKTIDQRFSS
jgi:anti-sigma factor RsiW